MKQQHSEVCEKEPCLLYWCHSQDTLCVVPLSATVMSLYTAQTPCVWSPCLLLSCPCTRPRHPVCGPLVCYCHVPVHGPDTLCVSPLVCYCHVLSMAQTPCVWSPCLLLSCPCTRPRHPVCGPLVCYCHVPVHGPDTLCVSPLVCYCHVLSMAQTPCVWSPCLLLSCPCTRPRHPVCGPLVCYCHVPVHGPDTLCVVPLSATVMSLYTAQTPCVWSPCLLLSCPCTRPRHPVCGPLVCYCHVPVHGPDTLCVVPLSATVMSLYTAQTPCVWSPCLLLSCPCTRPRHPVCESPCLLLSCPCTRPRHPVCGPLVCYCHVPVHGPDTLCVSPLVCYCHVPVHGPDTLCVVPSATVMCLYTAQTPCVWSPCLLLSCPCTRPRHPVCESPCLLLSCPCTRPRHPVCGPLVCYCHVPVHGPDTLCVVPLSATVMSLYTAQTPCV